MSALTEELRHEQREALELALCRDTPSEAVTLLSGFAALLGRAAEALEQMELNKLASDKANEARTLGLLRRAN